MKKNKTTQPEDFMVESWTEEDIKELVEDLGLRPEQKYYSDQDYEDFNFN